MKHHQNNFEYLTGTIYGFDYTKNEDGRYINRETARAFRIFCLGVFANESESDNRITIWFKQ